MRTNSPTKIMAVDYTPSSGSCGPASGIWTLTEIAQRLSRQSAWPKSLLTVQGPTEYTDFTALPNAGAAIDILLKCRTTTAVCTDNVLLCDTQYDYSAGLQWEVSKDFGASWQPLANRYNLSSQKISIGQRIRATKDENIYVDVPLPTEAKTTDGVYQFYGCIDSVRLSIGTPRYTETVVTPLDPNDPDAIDAATHFALNLGSYRGGIDAVGDPVSAVYAVPRPVNTLLAVLPHSPTLYPTWVRCSLAPIQFIDDSGAETTVTLITAVDDADNPIPHGLLSRTTTEPNYELVNFKGDIGVDDGTSSFSPTGIPSSLSLAQRYEIVNYAFTATTFCIRKPDDLTATPPPPVRPWSFAPTATASAPIYIYFSREPVFKSIIGDNDNVPNRPLLAAGGGLKYGNLEDGLWRQPRVDASVADTAARDALSQAARFTNMCVQTGTNQNAQFWILNSGGTWDEISPYSPAIQFLTREANYINSNESDSTYFIFDDKPRYGWPLGQFNISPNQKDFCLETYFKVNAFRHSFNGAYPANDFFKGVIINTQSGETETADALSGDGLRIYVTPKTQQTYGVATSVTVYEEDIGNLFVDIGLSSRALRFSGLHANRFYHVAVSRQVDTFRLYVDGIKVDELVLQSAVYNAVSLEVEQNHYLYRATWTRGALRANTSPAIKIEITLAYFYFTGHDKTYPANQNTTVMDDAGWIDYAANSPVLNSGRPIIPAVNSDIPERDPHVYVVEDSPSASGNVAIVTFTIKAAPYITFQNPLPDPVLNRADFRYDPDQEFPYEWESNKATGTGTTLGYTNNDGSTVAGTLIPPTYGSEAGWTQEAKENDEPASTTSGTPVSLVNYKYNPDTNDKTVLRIKTTCASSEGYGRNVVLRGRSWLEPLRAVFGIKPTQSNRDIAATLRHRVRVATTSARALSHTGGGHPVIDGVTLAPGDLILVKNEVVLGGGVQTKTLCGIYVYENDAWVTKWRRSNLMSIPGQFTPAVNTIAGVPLAHVGMRVEVTAGATNGGKVFRLVSSLYNGDSLNPGAEGGLSPDVPAAKLTLGSDAIDFQDNNYALAGVTAAEPVIPEYAYAVDTVTVRFSKPLFQGSFPAAVTLGKLTLEYYAGGALTGSPTTVSTIVQSQITNTTLLSNALFTINLGSLASATGLYKLTLNHASSGILDTAANLLADSPFIIWKRI